MRTAFTSSNRPVSIFVSENAAFLDEWLRTLTNSDRFQICSTRCKTCDRFFCRTGRRNCLRHLCYESATAIFSRSHTYAQTLRLHSFKDHECFVTTYTPINLRAHTIALIFVTNSWEFVVRLEDFSVTNDTRDDANHRTSESLAKPQGSDSDAHRYYLSSAWTKFGASLFLSSVSSSCNVVFSTNGQSVPDAKTRHCPPRPTETENKRKPFRKCARRLIVSLASANRRPRVLPT